MEKTGSDIILQTLKEQGTDVIFGYPGANTLPIHDSLIKSPIRHYLMRHEQAAAHAADGYARATGKVGVCLSTSGPGATNMVTGIATAYMDSTPLIALTGQVTTNLLGSDAFQETDIIGITMPITKHSFLINDVAEVASVLREAFELAKSGRPGPVLIDLPRNVLTANYAGEGRNNNGQRSKKKHVSPKEKLEQIRQIATHLNRAERPIIIIGGGVKLSKACNQLSKLIEKGRIPFVTTMMGIGSIDSSNGYSLGFIGTHGEELANSTVHHSDFILALGTRFSDRSTSTIEEFAPLATIAQIDIDPTSVGKNIKVDLQLISDISEAITELIPLIEKKERPEWFRRINKERELSEKRGACEGCGPAGKLIQMIQNAMPKKTTAIADVGLNQIWTVRSWQAKTPRGLITSGGMGTMGFSVPASIGAKIGVENQEVVAFSGDGGFYMNIQELATISYYNLPIKIVVFNNGNLGMIRQLQDLFYGARFNACELGDKVDMLMVSKGFGIDADRISVNDPEQGVEKMSKVAGPYLLEVMVDPDTYVFPLIPPGLSNIEMIYGRSD